MGSFNQAVKWLQQGKKVTCRGWVSPEYIFIKKGLWDNNIIACSSDPETKIDIDWLNLHQFLRKDWEILK